MTSRVALVTGGTGGIGTAIVKRLADMGHKVATNYRNEEKARAWQDKLKAEGYDVVLVKGDVTSPQEAEAMVREVESTLGPVDILVNNAGITRDGTFHKMKADQWGDVINTNLNSVFNVTRPVIEGMRDRKWGRVIQISSINGLKGQIGQVNFATAKAAMHGFSRALANEVATRGVTVNTISPGYIASQSISSFPPDVLDRLAGSVPIRRLGKPEEVASLCAWLASDDAAYVTGADYAVNGGLHMF
ncbi:MAG: acetoacetyl-CoA reductase [Thermomonas sp.]